MRLSILPRPWMGMRFHVPCLPREQTRHTIARGVRERGGELVGPEGPIDVLVVPEATSPGQGLRGLAARWLARGVLVMWEAAFLKALHSPPPWL